MNATLGQPARSVPTAGSFPERPLRVLHCLWSGQIGGAERAVYQLVREQLQDQSLRPGILFAQGRGHYWKRGQDLDCPVIDLTLPNGRALHRVPSIAARMRDFDVHHFHSAEPIIMLASILCSEAVRVYTHRGGLMRYSASKRIRYEMTGLLLRRSFHALSGNTRHGAQAGARLCRIDPSSFEITYNGLAFELLEPLRPAYAVREELGLSSTDFVIGTAATLKPWKRIGRLIDLVSRLRDESPKLVVVGDGKERGALEDRARNLGIGAQVVFAGAQTHVSDYLQIMDAFCLPSTGMESFGNAVVEAMAMGVPSLVFTDGGGVTEHIQHGRTGYVARDQEDLILLVRRLIADAALRKELGEEARTYVRRQYTLERSAGTYRTLYGKALDAKTSRREGS